MATTARPISNLDVSNADIMDLHSDSGLDFDDGDIELDIDPAPPAQEQDTDVLIEDVATDAHLDTQTVPADPDDFMVDHEESAEDNVSYNMDESNVATESNAAPAQEQAVTPAPPDDDLIDYSDEDDYDAPSILFPRFEEPKIGDVDTATHGDDEQNATAAVHDTESAEQRYDDVDDAHAKPDDHSEGEDGGVQLDEHVDGSEHHDDYEEQSSVETRPITVNYEGNELWLFKQHDTDDSGDWLTDDISLLHSSLSDLFHACRAALGEDISNETELGLRFDHFHNMEIFEDSTACVAVSLERMVEMYHTLQAQDGQSEPESFYMCLLSRPRFATLLSDVAKYAEEGKGYAAFNQAVAAGETHFVDQYSEHTTPQDDAEWDNADGADDGEHQEGTDSAGEVEHGVELQEYNEHDNVEEDAVEEQDHFSAHSEHESLASHHTSPHDANVEVSSTQAPTDPSAEQEREEQTKVQAEQHSVAQKEQLSNDTVDYSDHEDDEEPQEASLAGPPSSTTLQADHSNTDDTSVQVLEETAAESVDQISGGQDVDQDYLNDEYDFQVGAGEPYDQDGNAESYQEYGHQEYDQDSALAYDQGESLEELQTDASIAYPDEADPAGLTNQEYDGYDHDHLDQQLENDFISGADLDGTFAAETLNDVDDNVFLDLDNAPEWATDQEPTAPVPNDAILVQPEASQQDEKVEDGGLEQPAVAASSAAYSVAASSTSLHEVSPQGQKRSIDEVGDTVDDATDLTDMKRPRV